MEEITTTAAAQELKVSEARVRQLIVLGQLEGRKEPPDNLWRGTWWVTKESVERYQTERRKPGRPVKGS